MFDPEFFKNNRANLTKLFPDEKLFVFTAAGLLQRSGSTTYPFRQDSNFWYLTGIDEADFILVMNGAEEFLITQYRSATLEMFSGAFDLENLKSTSGISRVYPKDKGWQKLIEVLEKNKKAVTCLPHDSYIERAGFFTNPGRQRFVSQLKKNVKGLKLLDARPAFARLRIIKQPQELTAIQKAIDITAQTFELIKNRLDSFATETEVERVITNEFLKLGAAGHAYDPIVASGKNACTLHYIANKDKLEPGQPLLIDAGAEFSNYAADITRTYAVGKPTERQKQAHAAVMAVREYALGIIKPGLAIKEYEESVANYAGKQLQKLKLIKSGTPEQVRQYYPHLTSHFLGLDVHDVGTEDVVFTKNMVLTLEPGIYIPEESIGVRVEDNILITEDGVKILSADLDRSLI